MKLKLLILISLIVNQAFGQNDAVISGRVLDIKDKKPVPYASVTLNAKPNGKLITGTLTAEDGRFSIKGISEGEYIVICSFMGYKKKEIPVLIGQLNKAFDLGKIELEPEPAMLQEVVVNAKKENISAALDKKTFDLTNNISQSGGSVLDAIRNLPGVTIDQEGKVLLRGSDKVSVLLDGKQSSLTGFSNQKGLDDIPASNIERVEIINNPSAKYDSRGMAGIINIIYKEQRDAGFNGELGFNFGMGELTSRKANLPNISDKYAFTPKYNPSISLNYMTDKINVFLQSDGIIQKRVNGNTFSNRVYTDNTPDITSQFLENRTQQLYNIKGGFDWFINENNTLTVFSLFEDEYHIDRGDVPYDYSSTGIRKRLWTWAEDENTRFINYSTNYEHKFSEPGHTLEANFLYTKGGEDELFPFTDSSSTRNSFDETHLLVDEIITNVSVDYVKPLKAGRIETGSKIQLRKIPISYKINPGTNSILDPNLGEWSKYIENIYALYGNYVFESKALDIEAGMRLEQTVVNYTIDPANIYYTRNEAYDYLSLFPSIRLTYKLNPKNKLSAFFNRRVDRPGEFDLRPFPKYDDPEILKTGNPYLRPQFTKTYELAYKNTWGAGSFYLSGYYRDISDIFSRIFTQDNANSTIVNSITQNLGKASNAGFELNFDQSLTSRWNLNASLNWYRNSINAFSGISYYPSPQDFEFQESKINTYNIKLNSNWKLPLNTDFQLTGIYYAPDIVPQGKVKERYSVDFGLKKKTNDNKMEFTLSATDILNTFSIRRNITGSNFNLEELNYYETQVVTLGMKYKF